MDEVKLNRRALTNQEENSFIMTTVRAVYFMGSLKGGILQSTIQPISANI